MEIKTYFSLFYGIYLLFEICLFTPKKFHSWAAYAITIITMLLI